MRLSLIASSTAAYLILNNVNFVKLYDGCRGRTDKKLTGTLVIQTFLSFDLVDIFLKYGSLLFFKKAKKT